MSTWHMVCCCLAAIAGLSLGAQASAALPEGYTRLQYIQSNRSGNTRFVTNYTPQPNTDIFEVVFEPVQINASVNQAIWCARNNPAARNTYTFFIIGDKFRFEYGYNCVTTPETFGEAKVDTVYTVVASNNVITVNGQEGVTPAAETFTAGGPLMLFARYHNGTTANVGDYADIKLYSFKVWRKGELIPLASHSPIV